MGRQWNHWKNLFSWAPKSLQIVTTAMKLKDGCSLEKTMTNLDSILKSRDITLPTNVPIVKAMVFPVVMYGCESWTVKKAERWRIYAFQLWCRRRLLRVPWTSRRSNQSILKEVNPEYSLEWLLLQFQFFGFLMGRANSLEKTLILGKMENKKWSGWQRMKWLDGIINLMDMSLNKNWEIVKAREEQPPGVLQSMRLQLDMTEQLNDKQQMLWAVEFSGYLTHHIGRKEVCFLKHLNEQVLVNWSYKGTQPISGRIGAFLLYC